MKLKQIWSKENPTVPIVSISSWKLHLRTVLVFGYENNCWKEQCQTVLLMTTLYHRLLVVSVAQLRHWWLMTVKPSSLFVFLSFSVRIHNSEFLLMARKLLSFLLVCLDRNVSLSRLTGRENRGVFPLFSHLLPLPCSFSSSLPFSHPSSYLECFFPSFWNGFTGSWNETLWTLECFLDAHKSLCLAQTFSLEVA